MTPLTAEHYLLDIETPRDRTSSFGTYPFSLPGVKELSTLKLRPNVTLIVGENGRVKSTLLKTIATSWGFNPESRMRNFDFDPRRPHSELHAFLPLGKA